MKIISKCVLLLKAEKSEETQDKFEVMLLQEGFTVHHLKTLEFKFGNLEQLRLKLNNPHLYSGFIFTTPRSVKAVKETIGDGALKSDWLNKTNYVVGETTFSAALNELGLNCKGQESGNANNLKDVILKDKLLLSKPLLFPCGNLKTDDLITQLNNDQIEVESITVYETVASSTLDKDFSSVTSNFTSIPEYFVYFSPSGVSNTIKYISKLENQLDLIKFIAIGPTTESALKTHKLQVTSVALKPTPPALLQAILS